MNKVLTVCKHESGDGLADVARLVYVVAGPEEVRQIRPDVWSMLFSLL
jgi:hypothetical protein